MILPLIFGTVALLLLFIKLPGVAQFFHTFPCNCCLDAIPYFALLGAGYFSGFLAIIIFFRSLPHLSLKVCGLVWAIGLGSVLIWLSPGWCLLCLGAHLCHILLWATWRAGPEKFMIPLATKITLTAISTLVMMGVFTLSNLFLKK